MEEVKEPEDPTPWLIKFNDKCVDDVTRWLIPSGRSIKLFVKFYSKCTNKYQARIDFEALHSLKNYKCQLTAQTSVPSIYRNSVHVFKDHSRRKRRPKEAPNSYLSHVYVTSERCYDFGPLLIGKNPEDKENDNLMALNSSTLKITNSGDYEADVKFYLSSEVKAENAIFQDLYKEGIFFIEPREMTLGLMETRDIRVWAIP